MNEFESWLKRATWRLSRESARLVRTEIQEHYDSAREAATNAGASADEADRAALAALGDPKTANRQYRQVLLTSAEVRMLREANWEARAVCSRPWVKSLILAAPAGLLFLAAVAFLMDAFGAVRVLFAAGVAMGVLLTGPLFLPIYTPSRGRVYRLVKWTVFLGALGLAFGNDALKWSWLVASCLWPMIWIEWTRMSIRRKLPVAEWPKQLYL